MSFRLVPKSVTLNDLERRNGHYFAFFRFLFVEVIFRAIPSCHFRYTIYHSVVRTACKWLKDM